MWISFLVKDELILFIYIWSSFNKFNSSKNKICIYFAPEGVIHLVHHIVIFLYSDYNLMSMLHQQREYNQRLISPMLIRCLTGKIKVTVFKANSSQLGQPQKEGNNQHDNPGQLTKEKGGLLLVNYSWKECYDVAIDGHQKRAGADPRSMSFTFVHNLVGV